MSNFALDVNSPQGDIISSLNYVLANLNTNAITSNVIIDIVGNVLANANVVTTNSTSGQLSSVNQGTISYLYNYVNVKYANNNTGSIGFSSNCTGKSYYGIHNTNNGTISTNPADYNWSQVAGGFGTTKGLYYTPSGGGTVYFAIATTPPSGRYLPVIDNTPIYLQNLANSIVQTYNITPGAVTNVSIAANTITGNNINANTINGYNILSGAITSLQVADRTLSQAQIALGAITGNVISQQTLTGNLIALNTITGNLVALNTITGNLVAQNTITGNLIVPGTITGNLIQANTITGNLVQANTIQGNSIVSGSITADQLAANAITVNTVVSTGATLDNFSSQGFWLDGNTGNARFGNIMSIGNNLGVGNNAVVGNNLVVGNNAQIGGNLQVAGLITTGALNANTVATTTIVQGAVTSIFTNSVFVTSNVSSPVAYQLYAMGANVDVTGVNPSTSTFLVSASTGPALFFNSGTGPGAPAVYNVAFQITVQLPDGTEDQVYYYVPVINWVNYYENMFYVPNIQLTNWQLGPYNQSGTYKFFLKQAWFPGSYQGGYSPYIPTFLLDQGRTLSVQQIKR